MLHATAPQEKGWVVYWFANNLNLKSRMITLNKKWHSILVKVKIHYKEVTLINMYTPNTGATSYIRQTLMDMKNLISNTTILTRDLNTPLSQKDR